MATMHGPQDSADGDATVYLPATVRVEIYGDEGPDGDGRRRVSTLRLPAEHVTLTREFLFVRRPGVPSSTFPLSAIRAIHIDIQPTPADYDTLRERYPHAYEAWFRGDIAGLLHQQNMGSGIEDIAERTGRPPEHVRRKLADPSPTTDEEQPPQRRDPAPIERADPDERIEGSYIVSIREGADPLDVAARHGIDPDGVQHGFNMFGAELTEAQVESLRYDPDTKYLSENQWIHMD